MPIAYNPFCVALSSYQIVLAIIFVVRHHFMRVIIVSFTTIFYIVHAKLVEFKQGQEIRIPYVVFIYLFILFFSLIYRFCKV
jgi:hypothetical protein